MEAQGPLSYLFTHLLIHTTTFEGDRIIGSAMAILV
jgi:hypothetical protein